MTDWHQPPAASSGSLHLTYDDGPDPDWTPQVLEVLAHAEAQATFFVLGAAVRAHPALVAAIKSAGHRVELHGDAHLDHRVSTHEALAGDTSAALQSLHSAGIEPRWWRLPWGRPGASTDSVASAHNLRIVGWNVDTHDWRGDGPSDQGRGLRQAAKLGGVVLLHDGRGPGADRPGIANTLALTKWAIDGADTAGTPVVALPDPQALCAARLPSTPTTTLPSAGAGAEAVDAPLEMLR